jgi:hypothetical protein
VRGERALLRLGEYLLARACRQLPRRIRDERYREWAAELPIILHDPAIRPAPRRAVRMVIFAADTFRGAARTHARSRRGRRVMTAVTSVLLVAQLACVVSDSWNIARAPGQALNYLLLAWCSLLVASLVSMLARPAARVSTGFVIGIVLGGVAVYLWDAAQDPGDWVNYPLAVCLVLVWPVGLWARARLARTSVRRQSGH